MRKKKLPNLDFDLENKHQVDENKSLDGGFEKDEEG